MKTLLTRFLKISSIAILLIVLILTIWQPVMPSVWIIEKIADYIDADALPQDKTITVRFELAGRGGGDYNLVAGKDAVSVSEGEAESIDLIIAMEAREFNSLMWSLGRGKADQFTIVGLVVANKLSYTGDLNVLNILFKDQGENI